MRRGRQEWVWSSLNHHLVEPFNVLYEKEGKIRHCITGLIHLYIRVNVITGLSTSWGGNAGQRYALS